MRTLIESKHVLVVEERGRIMLCAVLAAIVLHGILLCHQTVNLLRVAMTAAAYANLAVSGLVYLILLYVVSGPFSDKRTVTFHGIKNVVTVERSLPFAWKMTDEIPFGDFDCFEVSRPEAKGFCRLRLKNGKTRSLLRLTATSDLAPFEHLDQITRKKVEIVV